MSPTSPLPLLNAARVYQQLGQSVASQTHIREALSRDSTMSLAYVDAAQLCLQATKSVSAFPGTELHESASWKLNKAREATLYLQSALKFCRHVSEVADVFATKTIALIHYDALTLENPFAV